MLEMLNGSFARKEIGKGWREYHVRRADGTEALYHYAKDPSQIWACVNGNYLGGAESEILSGFFKASGFPSFRAIDRAIEKKATPAIGAVRRVAGRKAH